MKKKVYYGYNTDSQNKKLLQNITDVISEIKRRYPTDYNLAGGDYGCYGALK